MNNKLYWCLECNVPIAGNEICPSCKNTTMELKVYNGDLKPVFPKERNLHKKILKEKMLDINLPNFYFISRGTAIIDGEKVFRIGVDDSFEWRISLYKKFENGSGLEFKGCDKRDVIRNNLERLKRLEKNAIDFIKKTIEEYHKPVIVSFSGGKDSGVLLHLVSKAISTPKLYFIDTTLELPGTEEYLHRIEAHYGIDIFKIRPMHTFFDMVDLMGMPSRFMRWCCNTQKFAPVNKFINENYKNGVLTLHGGRKLESLNRRDYEEIDLNRSTPKAISVYPILNWTTLDVWLYTLWRKIPINPAYYYGYPRLGCWACPGKSKSHFKILSETYPILYNMLLNQIEKNMWKYNYPEYYKNKWKWIVWRNAFTYKPAGNSASVCDDETFTYTFNNGSDMKKIKEFLKIFGELTETKLCTWIKGDDIEISLIENEINVRFKVNNGITNKFNKQLKKALNCVGCGVCVAFCSNNAIRIDDKEFTIDENRCNHCLNCTKYQKLQTGCVALNYKPIKYNLSGVKGGGWTFGAS